MRLFVAIEVGPTNAGEATGRPTAVEHVTLRFLGETSETAVRALSEALARVAASTAPFDLVLAGVGAFPSPSRPRVVYVGARAGGPEATELARRIATALGDVAGPSPAPERFVPHLTLLRVRSRSDRERAHALLDGSTPAPPPRTVRVDRIVLKASTLAPTGARHRTVAEFPFGGGHPGAA